MTQPSRIDGLPDLPKPGAMTCTECGMLCEWKEFHPFAACLMFKGCRDSDKVRANLNAVREAGSAAAAQAAKQVPAGQGIHDFAGQPSVDGSLAALVADQQSRAAEAGQVEAEPENFVTRWSRVIRDMPSTYEHPAPASPQAPAPQAVVGEASEPTWYKDCITLNALQLRHALDFAAPDFDVDEDQRETQVSIAWAPHGATQTDEGEPDPAGYKVWMTDYPEEGSMPLDESPAGFPVKSVNRMNVIIAARTAPSAAPEWQTPPASWRLLAKAAINLLCAIDEKHDNERPPTKYAVPYGAVNDLRNALGAATPRPDASAVPHQGADALREDAERWRLIAGHWKGAQMRWKKSPNVPRGITITVDFAVQAAEASQIEGFLDAARAALAQHQAPQQGEPK